jgi:hypothetical protein
MEMWTMHDLPVPLFLGLFIITFAILSVGQASSYLNRLKTQQATTDDQQRRYDEQQARAEALIDRQEALLARAEELVRRLETWNRS